MPGRFRAILTAWFSKYARGRSLPIVAALVVLVLGLPNELVDILREFPCNSAVANCCEQLNQRCPSPTPGRSADAGQLNVMADQARDLVTDWLSRIWTLLF